MLRGGFLIRENAGAFHGDIDVELLPGKLRRVAFGGDFDLTLADIHPVVSGGDLVGEPAMDRIVLQQMGIALRVAQIVDANKFNVAAPGFNCRPHDQATNSTKTVDSYTHCHFQFPYTRSRMAASTAAADIPKCS